MGIWRVTRGKGKVSPEEAKEIIDLLTIDISVREQRLQKRYFLYAIW